MPRDIELLRFQKRLSDMLAEIEGMRLQLTELQKVICEPLPKGENKNPISIRTPARAGRP